MKRLITILAVLGILGGAAVAGTWPDDTNAFPRPHGTSVGQFAYALNSNSVAIAGQRELAWTGTNASGAVQMGAGSNVTANTFQFRGTVVVDANGNIPTDDNMALSSNKVLIGDASGVAQEVTLSGDIATTPAGVVTVVDVQDDSVDQGDLSAGDRGDIVIGADGAMTLDADVVAPAEMADADHGDFTYVSGVATLDADVVAPAEMANADHGDVMWSNGVAYVQDVQDDSVDQGDLSAGDRGDITIGADGTMTVDDAAVGAAEVGAGMLRDTVIVQSDSISNALNTLFGNVDVVAAAVSSTQATITCTCQDLFGNTLADDKAFIFWFSTASQQTTPSIEGIESWTYQAHGDVRAYLECGDPTLGATTNYVYVGQTHTDGTMDFLVTADAGPWTNYFHVLGPNGTYSKTAVPYTD